MKIKKSIQEKVFDAFNYILLALFMATCVIPFLNVIAKSFSSEISIAQGVVGIVPIKTTLLAYEAVFKNAAFLSSFKFTVLLTLLGTFTNLIFTILAAYPLSRQYLPGRRYIWIFIIITMFISGGLIPTYIIVKSLGLLNNIWALILPGAVSTYNMIIMKTSFESLPIELEESSKLDGCTEMQILFRIMLPLSLPTIAALSLFYCVTHWNQYMQPLLYMSDPQKYTLQLRLKTMIPTDTGLLDQEGLTASERPSESLKAAAVIVSTVPILVVYPWLQKYFVKGTLVGAVKG